MDSKIKILMISDDIRAYTGVGIQSYKLLTELAKMPEFEVVQIGQGLFAQNPNPVMYKGVKIYPRFDYGDANMLREVLAFEKPDIVIPFGDPRFFSYLFSMDSDIRKSAPLVFYHLWDNEPFPKYNTPWYKACDELVMITKFSYDMYTANGWDCSWIPHGYDENEFTKLKEIDYIPLREDLMRSVKQEKTDFIILWNNRNLHRKRGGDILRAFHDFWGNTHKDAILIMHSDPVAPNGYDLIGLNDDLTPSDDIPVIFSTHQDVSLMINKLYNIADVTINVSYNEGFGLCVGESLLTETPVIATDTGGMTEQLETKEGCAGYLLKPSVQHLMGVPGNTYVFQDFVSHAQIVQAFTDTYEDHISGGKGVVDSMNVHKGRMGRDHIVENYNIKSTVDKWVSFLREVKGKEYNYKSYRFFSLP